MSFFKAMDVSSSGMRAQRFRVDVATSNLANAETTRGPDGGPWRRLDPILRSEPMDAGIGARPSNGSVATVGVTVAGVSRDDSGGRPIYNPDHPDADEQGFVMLPNVNPIHEVVNLTSASRSYEANATAFESVKMLARRALDLLR